MTPKEYLSQAFRLDRSITSKLSQLDSLKALATRATSGLSGMPGSDSPDPHRFEATLVKIADLEREIDGEIDRLVDLKREIKAVINSVADQEHRTLLELRYQCFMTWEQIAVTMNYSIRNVYRTHGNALKSIQIPQSWQ